MWGHGSFLSLLKPHTQVYGVIWIVELKFHSTKFTKGRLKDFENNLPLSSASVYVLERSNQFAVTYLFLYHFPKSLFC